MTTSFFKFWKMGNLLENNKSFENLFNNCQHMYKNNFNETIKDIFFSSHLPYFHDYIIVSWFCSITV